MTTVLLFALLLVTSVISMLVSEEAQAQWTRACRALINRAAHALPPTSRERYREEWLAELEMNPGGPISHMWWASSLLISRHRIAAEVRPPVEATADPDVLEMAEEEPESLVVVRAAEPEIIVVRTVPQASNAAARLLEMATRHGDGLIEAARAEAERILGVTRSRDDGDPAPQEHSRSMQVQVPDDAPNAAARLLELATRNADELLEEATLEAQRIVDDARSKAARD